MGTLAYALNVTAAFFIFVIAVILILSKVR